MTRREPLAPEDRITRYINEKGKLRPSIGKAGYNAFMPPRKNLRLSVYCTQGLEDPEIWQIAQDSVGTPERSVLGRSDLPAAAFFSHTLTIDQDGNPHPLHANVIGWPDDHELQRAIALELAESAALVLNV